MGSGVSRRFPNGVLVKVDIERKGNFDSQLIVGKISGACASLERNNFEYTVFVDETLSVCVAEQHLEPLTLPEFEWISIECREVAVWVETHGHKRFAANIIRRDDELHFDVRFIADGTLLECVAREFITKPDEATVRDASPSSMSPDPMWLLDRKLQAQIDINWPMQARVEEVVKTLRIPRPASTPPLCGPFVVGKKAFDSEGFPAHPSPPAQLTEYRSFVEVWSRYAGKIKFAPTYKIGPSYPRYDAWVDSVDAGDPLYFHAALPVYAGLICLGKFHGQPEWIRASDVALVGIALYVNGELHEGIIDPPMDKNGLKKYGHESCSFIPGCVSTYTDSCEWVGSVFCLAPADQDEEVRDDRYSIEAYHKILADWPRILRARGGGQDIMVEVNLVLSTNYLANWRQVCSGAIHVTLSDKGILAASARWKDVQFTKMNSQAAKFPRRARKTLSEVQKEPTEEEAAAAIGRSYRVLPSEASGSVVPPPPPPPPPVSGLDSAVAATAPVGRPHPPPPPPR